LTEEIKDEASANDGGRHSIPHADRWHRLHRGVQVITGPLRRQTAKPQRKYREQA
jgi:hypothetical protein